MIKENDGFDGIDGLDLSSLFNKDNGSAGDSNSTNASISSIPMEEELDEDGVNNADDNDNPPIDTPTPPVATPKKGAIGEEEDEDEEDEDADSSDDDIADSKEENPYTIFAKLLKENGVLSEVPDDLEDSDEAISTLVSKEIDNKVNAWIADLPEEVKFIVENYKDGVDYNKLIQKQAAIESYKSITPEAIEENDGLQEAVVLDYLIKNGWSEDEAKEEVKEYKDASLLESKAKKYVKKLVDFEETEKRAIAAQERDAARLREENYKQHIKQLEASIKSREEIIPGVKLSDTERKQLFEGITKFDSKGENAIMKFRKDNPDFDLTMAYVATVLKGDFSKISKVATTQATRKLAKTIDNAGKSTSKKTSLSLEIIKKALKH